MSDKHLVAMGSKSFEDLKKINEYGAEYWSAREIQPLLGYAQWRRFEDAVKRAITSCKQSGNDPLHHFAGVGKMIDIGKGGSREVPDYHLSRFACYLIAQNGDPRKSEIANAQKYFAIQARRQEISDAITADVERLELRKQTAEEFKALSGAAREAGVHDKMFGVFHDAGYKGMYGGMGRDAIKRFKRIPEKENLMDRMDTTELAANQFRMTQTRDKLARERIRDQQGAIRTHESVGKEVRDAIKRIGGTPPEHLPPAEHIKLVEKRVKGTSKAGTGRKRCQRTDRAFGRGMKDIDQENEFDRKSTTEEFSAVQKEGEIKEKSVAEEFSVTASDGNNTVPSITTLMPYNWVKL